MPEPAWGATLPLASAIPFVGILLSIALLPPAAPRFWHRHHAKVAVAWAIAFGLPFLATHGSLAVHEILHIYLADYIPFLILIWALFTAAGGIVVRGGPAGTPAVNTTMIAIGTLLASVIGTTGAAMLLIRPLLLANAGRKSTTHLVVFLIILVANIGGCLTPLGDPPLFLGFLQGVPFFWTLRLAGPLIVLSVALLAVLYAMDRHLWRRDVRSGWMPGAGEGRLRVAGAANVPLLLGIVGAVLLSGSWKAGAVSVLGVELRIENLVRDVILILVTAASLWITPRALREANQFSWAPIREVAWLFAGIFMTIIPALAMLEAGENGPLGSWIGSLQTPWQFFWATGGLSAFLDNAPTYLAFLHSLVGRFHPGIHGVEAVQRLASEQTLHLEAIAAGAVFMGALTYIGNAPNFMVKSIAEEAGVRMPSFFGYLFRWTIPLLVPLFLLVGWIFFRE